MPRPTGDDVEFDEAEAPKAKPKSKSKSKVADKPVDAAQEDTVIEPEPPKSRFHPRYLTEAHRLGISPGEIDACANNSELRELVEYERRAVSESQRSQSSATQQRTRADAGHEAPAPHVQQSQVADEDEWTFEDEEVEEMLDPKIKKELKRLGKATKLSKADRELMKTLQEQLEEAKAEIAAMKANSDPKVQLAISTFAKYPALFGNGRPAEGTPESVRQKMTMDYIFGAMKASGEFTGDPSTDIPKAVSILFPGQGAGQQAAPAAPAKPKPSRIDEWNDSAQLTPTNRNGADRTGKPGGRSAAARKVSEKRRELGLIPDDFEDDIGFDDDDDDDI